MFGQFVAGSSSGELLGPSLEGCGSAPDDADTVDVRQGQNRLLQVEMAGPPALRHRRAYRGGDQ